MCVSAWVKSGGGVFTCTLETLTAKFFFILPNIMHMELLKKLQYPAARLMFYLQTADLHQGTGSVSKRLDVTNILRKQK